MWTEVEQPRIPPDDPVLVGRFRSGDTAAFDEIVGCHRRIVYSVALRFLGNHADADEAAQSALVRAWQSRAQFRGDSTLRTWLIRIVLNVARSMRSGVPPTAGLDSAAELHDPRASADAQIGALELRARMQRAVDALPPRQREVVLLKVFSEMTYKDVAESMHLSEGAVKAHLHQAVANLRRALTAADAGV